MKIKSFLITAVLTIAVLCSAGFAKAQTTDNSALIAQLRAEIQLLIQQIAQLQGQQSTTAWCHTFNSYLVAGSTGSEVDNLWTALGKNDPSVAGSLSLDHAGMGQPSTFGDNTATAVVAFQGKYGIRQTGTVGPLTRAKLNSLYGCPLIPPSITITSPSGGSIMAGSTVPITWNLTGSNSASYYTSYQILLKSMPTQILGTGGQSGEISYNLGSGNNGGLGYPLFTVQMPSDVACAGVAQQNCGFIPGTYYIEIDLSNNSYMTNPVVGTSNAFTVSPSAVSEPNVTFTASNGNLQTVNDEISAPVGTTTNFSYSSTNATNCYVYANNVIMNNIINNGITTLTQGATSGNFQVVQRSVGDTTTYEVICWAGGQQVGKGIILNATN